MNEEKGFPYLVKHYNYQKSRLLAIWQQKRKNSHDF
jgi:hypothetical protein